MAGAAKSPLVLVGAQEFAGVYDGPARNTAQWIQRGVLGYDEAVIVSGRAYWPIGVAVQFGEATERKKVPNMEFVEKLVAEQAPGRSVKAALAVRAGDLPPIVGSQEIMVLVGEDPATAGGPFSKAMKDGVFTEPDWRLSGSPLWLLPNALAGLDRMRERPRSRPLEVIPAVLESLEGGTYDGPGSQVITRGRQSAES
ncbi:hypothetical protein OG455_27705 [Kitasatospora sp. NBC_01287]|uniref:hypothetical protein n=1 Tax=Kitasatospora sp. NBC_01287 TaxID=2903573 RepID=UPI00225A6F1D|nr:hypothetical protein [Kitasatospora sp. NBC_01287]MCX4749247.1 hypothetical protein [Kitasatospora sp. NBC_01287]